MLNMSVASAKREAGEVSGRNSKMPGSTFAVSPSKCNVGSKLVAIEGSTCHKCYAIKLERIYPSVRMGWNANYLKATRMIETDPAAWAKAMAFQIHRIAEKTGEAYHRWFDGGDLASLAMLRAIALTCELTPSIAHWMPTREAAIVKAYRETYGALPSNLVVRISSTMIGDAPITGHGNTSTVHRKGESHDGRECKAYTRDNSCGPCRDCWDATVPNVSYKLH